MSKSDKRKSPYKRRDALSTVALSPRERELLDLIASGTRQVAEELGIAFKTAVSHRYHLHEKLRVHNAVMLTRVAIRMGLIEA